MTFSAQNDESSGGRQIRRGSCWNTPRAREIDIRACNALEKAVIPMKNLLLAGVSALALAGGAASARADTISYTGTIVDYTVPTTGTYDITAYGAQGGDSTGVAGGLGAEIGGIFSLTAGETLEIAVGQAGGSATTGAGGGGGSFVIANNAPLVIAGGGGGASGTHVGGGGGTGTSGGGPRGGSGGNGGGGHTYMVVVSGGAHDGGGGGAGYNSDGGTGLDDGSGGDNNSGGFAGGAGFGGGGYGGFGGGGGGGGNAGGGGGGGYSGGGGGGGGGGSGGGGSIDNGTYLSAVAAANIGNGYVTITYQAVPEPASSALLGAGLFGLGVARRRALRRKA
jgi:hypothetical protein